MKRMKPSSSMIVAIVALVFSMGGAGMAATGYRITSLWQIAPNVRHALRGEQGPPGPRGPVGPAGVVGAQGPAAELPPGLVKNDISVYETGATLQPGAQNVQVVAVCPYGTMVGGGYTTTGATILNSAATSGRNWEWDVLASNPTSSAQIVRAYVDCATTT